MWNSHCGTVGEELDCSGWVCSRSAGSIPGLLQWVKRILHCLKWKSYPWINYYLYKWLFLIPLSLCAPPPHTHTFLIPHPFLSLEVIGSLPNKVHNEETLKNCQHLENICSWWWPNRYLHSKWRNSSDPCYAWLEHLLGINLISLISVFQ